MIYWTSLDKCFNQSKISLYIVIRLSSYDIFLTSNMCCLGPQTVDLMLCLSESAKRNSIKSCCSVTLYKGKALAAYPKHEEQKGEFLS